MKTLIIFLLIITPLINLESQAYRPYSEGPLAYNDFQGDPLEIEGQSGMVYLRYEFIEETRIIDGISFPYMIMEAKINTEQSWLNFDLNPDGNLEYFQILFDLEDLYAQKYNAIIINNPMDNTRQLSEELFNEKQIVIDKYKLESQSGRRIDINLKWKERIKKELNDIVISTPTNKLSSNNGFDAHLGLGYNLLGDDLNDFYGNALALAFGFNLNIKNFYLVFSGSLGVGKTKMLHSEFPYWKKAIHRNDAVWNFGLGRKFKTGKFYFSPFIGPSLLNVYVNKIDYEGIFPETSDTKWKIGGGFFFDFPISKTFTNSNYLNTYSSMGSKNIFYNHGLRLSFHYVPSVDLFDSYSGDAKSVTLSYYFYLGDLKDLN